MDGFLLLVVLDVDDICEYGEELPEELWIGVYSCTVNGRAVVVTIVVLDNVVLLELIEN